MLKHLMKWRVAAFEKRYEYDASYLRELAESDPRALMAFAKMQGMSRYRGGLPTAAWFAAKIVGAMYEDCGPCTQLVVRMAEEGGVDGPTLRALVGGHDAALTEELRDVVAFARASLAHGPADDERPRIERRFGARGLAAIAFSLAAARVYPTVKYALGHGRACQRIAVAGELVPAVGPRYEGAPT